jgi:hypothetical protein
MKTIVAAVAAAVLAAAPAARAGSDPAERFSAFAVNLDGPYGAATALLQIRIDRWSTPQEVERLRSVFTEGGADALLDAVRETPRVGSVRTTQSLGHDLRFAYAVPLPDGARRIVIGTDRRTAFWEAANQTRSLDYPFTVIEMRVDRNGKGQGKLVAAGRMTAFGDEVEVENFNLSPVRLMQVNAEK